MTGIDARVTGSHAPRVGDRRGDRSQQQCRIYILPELRKCGGGTSALRIRQRRWGLAGPADARGGSYALVVRTATALFRHDVAAQ